MKSFIALLFAAVVAATPIAHAELEYEKLYARQITSVRNELEDGSADDCPTTIFIFARASTEQGNTGILGVQIGNALEERYGADEVWVQGVAGPYRALLSDNFLPRGTTPENIAETVRLFNLAHDKCPNTPVVAGGYSQGSALIAAAISDLTPEVRDQIVGVTLFGYTRNLQNNGGIPNYPQDRVRVYCEVADLVCEGTLFLTPTHFFYIDEARDEAPTFLISQIDAALEA